MNVQDILFYLYSGIPVLNLIMCVVLVIILTHTSKSKNQLNEFSRILYLSFKREEQQKEMIQSLQEELLQLQQSFESLSTSTTTVLEEMKQIQESDRVWPTPQLAEMVGTTIKEQLFTELTLSRKLRIPNQSSIENVIRIASDTYPHVSIDYITRRTFAEVENMQRQQE